MTMTPFTVCIPAAGSGTRMKSDMPKQYLPLFGRPVLLHTLDVFSGMTACVRIVIATDDVPRVHALLREGDVRPPVEVVDGGVRRQDSVERAIAAVQERDMIVLVHDAARPCVEARHVQLVADAAHASGAALLAVPVRDTLKEVRDGAVRSTLDRSVIWQAQTPQAARADLFRDAFRHAHEKEITATDDVSLLEAIGCEVRVVEGSPENIKITQPEDLAVAEAILRRQGRMRDGAERA